MFASTPARAGTIVRTSIRIATLVALAAPAVAFASDSSVTRGTDHVVIISLDGLRPDAIEKYGAKTIMRLMREGSSSMSAQTILPSELTRLPSGVIRNSLAPLRSSEG